MNTHIAKFGLAGIPVRSTFRGAVSSFQVDRAVFTDPLGGRLTYFPWPSSVRTSPSWTTVLPRESVKRGSPLTCLPSKTL